ncbi:MAG: GWxTD domain-containing protein [Ignavibacteriae bacterium]|nr:GWxTD domain-containing protein [Ignavibacteriota bacterium]
MRSLLLGFAALAPNIAIAVAQVEVTKEQTLQDESLFDVDAISFASDSAGRSRLDVYVAIPYEHLSFVKSDDKFVANYEMTLSVYDSAKALVTEKLWTREAKTASFEQSVSSGAYSVEQLSLLLRPAYYQLSVQCRDLESRTVRRVSKQITIPDYSMPGFHLSDIMLISKMTMKGDKRSITPSISPNVGNIATPFHIFFEAYNSLGDKPVRFMTSVYDVKKALIASRDTLVALAAGRNQIFLPIDQSAMSLGAYTLYVQAFTQIDTIKALTTTSRAFDVRWSGMPKSVKDLDLSIEQLVYIAKDKELDNIRDAKTPEEKQKLFLEFWKKKDPNPNTLRNEKMEEYYQRVEYANKHFKHYTEGWRTDMGMVYIIFGTPNNVDRHPFDSDSKPYEVWSYYELNYSFVFVDQSGFGDYRLATPLWEVWNRAKN